VGVLPRPVVLLPSPRVGAVGRCCVVALCCGPAVVLGLHDTGMGVGHHRHLHGVGSRRHLPCMEWAWLVQGHWCDLGTPRNVEKTAVSGDTACLGVWRQLGHVPGPAAEAVMVLCGVVLCVVCCGTCSRSQWLAVMSWGSV
jgi:hypothetical protein